MRLNKPSNISLILKITKNYIQNGDKFNNYFHKKKSNFYLNELPLIASPSEPSLFTFNNNFNIKTIRHITKRSKKLPSLCPFYNSQGDIMPSVIETSRVTHNKFMFQSASMENISHKPFRSNTKNRLKQIDLSMDKFKSDFFDSEYSKLVYDEREIFNVGDKWDKEIKNRIVMLKKEKNENLTYELDKEFHIGCKMEKVNIKITSMKIFFDKTNSQDKPIEFSIPFALLPLFYYKGIHAFKLLLLRIILMQNQSITINENSIYSLLESTNIYNSHIHHSTSTAFSTPPRLSNTSITNLPPPSKRLHLITHSLISHIIHNQYNEYQFIWSTTDSSFQVKVVLPKIVMTVPSMELVIDKYIDMEIVMYLITKKFVFWDFYIINYLFTFKKFRNIISKIFSINNSVIRYKHISVIEKKICSTNTISSNKDFIEGIFTHERVNYFNKINCTRVQIYRISSVEENAIDEFVVSFNISQMRKFCLMRKHNDNNLSFLHNFIIINHNDKKNLSFNYKLLDDFDVTKWIDDYNKYNRNSLPNYNSDDSLSTSDKEEEIKLNVIESFVEIHELKDNYITKIKEVELDRDTQNKLIEYDDDNLEKWVDIVLKDIYNKININENINNTSKNVCNSVNRKRSSNTIFSPLRTKMTMKKSSSKLTRQTSTVSKFAYK